MAAELPDEVFFADDTFGDVVVLIPLEGARRGVRAIFDDPYFDAGLGEYHLEISKPRLTARAADLAGMRRGDEVEIAGTLYDVLSQPQDDGTGIAMLELAKKTRPS